MNLNIISKTKLINIIIQDCKELKKIAELLYSEELAYIIMRRIEKPYYLNYKVDRETQLRVFDLMKNNIYGVIDSLKKDLQGLIK